MSGQYWSKAEREAFRNHPEAFNLEVLAPRILATVGALESNEGRNMEALEAAYARLPVNKDDSTESLRRTLADRIDQTRALLTALK